MVSDSSSSLIALAQDAKAWPFAEARLLIDRLKKMKVADDYVVIFETGYGPSGLPHIGTFGEVVRTSMVRHAYEVLTGRPTRLICFSDDMDGLRKVPDNVPNKDLLAEHLGKALTQVPDPFGTHDSFGAHNNARLCAFLDSFGFEYEFYSATECYQSGQFDAALQRILEKYDSIINVVLPTLGEERKATYSPFLPVCQRTGQVLQVPITHTDPENGLIQYTDPDTGEAVTTGIDKGKVKLQWKCDWAMRWFALGVDYEMSGKDLSESVKLSSKITHIMGATPPAGFSYELFLDQNGEKISKSRGNGLSVEEWLTYGTAESLSLFMYNQPKRAKRLYFDVVPKMVDEYYSHLSAFTRQESAAQIDNPVWHIHKADVPATDIPVSFSLLLNLAGVCQAETAEVIWGYLGGYLAQYASDVTPDTHPELARLVDYAVTYYQDRVRPFKHYRQPTEDEIGHLKTLASKLAELPAGAEAEDIQSAVFAVGKDAGYEPLRGWFSCLYQVLLGQDEGPRMGSFITLYGMDAMQQLIMQAVNGDLAGEAG